MNYLEQLHDKIVDREKLLDYVKQWRAEGCKIVFTNGCFDLLHRGHIDYLAHAAANGDRMIVALNTDSSVSALKGKHRPINDEQSRAFVLAALTFVSAVTLFNEPTPLQLIEAIQPDVLIKGADYKTEEIVGYEIVMARGGKVATVPLVEGYSTSLIEEKIRKSY